MNMLLQLVQDYLKQENTDFAILINGEWGSGKTHFWKNVIVPEIERIEYSNNGKGQISFYKPVYVSLFGVSSVSAMTSRLSSEILPFKELREKKAAKLAMSVGKFLADKIGNYSGIGNMDVGDVNSIDELILDSLSSDKVLCFDDIERVEPKVLSEVLGYINQFVEHDNLKIILLADEKRIPIEHGAIYPQVKEKLIRFTFQFNPSLKDLFPTFLAQYKNKQFEEAILSHERMIVEAFRNAKHTNLRTLKFILDVFKKVYDTANECNDIKNENRSEVLAKLLLFTVCYSIEYKRNSNDDLLDVIKEIESIPTIDYDLLFKSILEPASVYDMKEDPKRSEKEEYSLFFREKYLQISGYAFFKYRPSIKQFIHTGYLDKTELINELVVIQKEIDAEKVSREQELMTKLSYGGRLEDEDYEQSLNELIERAKKGMFTVQSYPQIASSLLGAERHKLNGFKFTKKLFRDLKKGMDLSFHNSSFQPRFSTFYTGIDTSDVRVSEIAKYSIELNERIQLEDLKNYAPNLIKAIKANDENSINEMLSSNESKGNAFLQHINPKDFCAAIIAATNATKISVEQNLELRYSSKYVPNHLKEELYFLEETEKLLIKHLNTHKKASISTLNVKIIKNLISNLIKNSKSV